MDSYRNTAIIVGVLFISATVFSILGTVALGSILNAPNYLSTVSAHGNQLVTAVIFWIIAAFSAFATSFMLFPVLRRHIESLAMGYVGLRLMENILYVMGALSLLITLTLSQKYVAGAIDVSVYQSLGVLLLALQNWSVLLGTLVFFGIGSLMLNYVLYQSKLVPRWLSLFGLIGAALALLFGLLGVAGIGAGGLSSPYAILAAPIAVQEMVFAVWLIFKGFNPEAIASGQ